MTRRRRPLAYAWAAIIATSALVLSGCAGQSGQADGSETLRLSSTTVPASFALGEYGGGEYTLYTSIFDTLLTLEEDGTLTPGLAESWAFNDDRTVLTLKIREGVEFSNGEVADAGAAAASLEAQRTGPSTSASWTSVDSIIATDDNTLVVEFNEPDAAILPGLAVIGGIVAAPSTIGSASEATQPVGSGAYTLSLDETQIGTKYVLEKNEEYWNSERYPFDRVEWTLIPDFATSVNGLQSGQLDHVVGISPEQAEQLSGQFEVGVDNPTTFGVIWIADRAGETLPALGDLRVRQAINMAFDRESITENLEPGVRTGMEQVYSPSGGAYLEELEGRYAFDVEGAKKLLAEAGYPDGFTVTMPSSAASTPTEPLVTQSLAEIGITVNWETVALQDVVAKFMAGDYPMFFFPSAWQAADAIDTSGFLGTFNPFDSTSPELEELLKEANASNEPDAFAEVNRYFIENAWYAPLTYNTFNWAHTRDIVYTPPTVWGVSLRPWTPAS